LQIPKGHVGVKKKLLADDKTTGPNDLLHSTNDVCGVLLKDSPFKFQGDNRHVQAELLQMRK
jgi:hypothetical protein